MPPQLIVLIGLPGSGKSTFARQWQRSRPDRLLISTDAIRAALFGDEAIQGSWDLIWRDVERQFQQAVQQMQAGQVSAAIYDATNAVRRHRRAVLALARATGFAELVGIWLDVPLPVCLSRNQQRDRSVPDAVIQRMHRRLVGAPPSLAEGFDRLIRYTDFSPLGCPLTLPN
ncbi:MAG: AAA family ATPase [Leptolyngbyaceae cyanobacterium SL_7_1]|nr:AAA family ATPase [Leptolyngbyaceae cyanobacterium SL_7_1]